MDETFVERIHGEVVRRFAAFVRLEDMNKAEYLTYDAPSRRLREGITDLWMDGPMDGPTDRRSDQRMDTPSYRDATAHLKMCMLFSIQWSPRRSESV